MKLKELKKLLNNYDENLEVVISADSEGNSFSLLDDIQEFKYAPYDQFHGEVFDITEETKKPTKLALVFFPCN